jgi:zinc D-Ala-D-Ala carboxypeptidase
MNLSENFTLAELIRTSTGLDNTPNEEQIENLRLLCVNVLQPARDALGVIKITSGFRAPAVNAKIGGAPSSQHVKGQAADLMMSGGQKKLLDWIIANVEFDQIISEFPDKNGNPAWVHVSFAEGKNRMQKLKAIKSGGKTKYVPL